MNEQVSVIMAAYNGARYIEDALRSVFAQTSLPREIIVVDDGSTDASVDVVRALVHEAPVPLKLIERGTNSGSPSRPMNVGIAAASGELIAILDQDDLFRPMKLAQEADVLAAHPELTFVSACCGHAQRPAESFQSPEMIERLRQASVDRGGYWQLSDQASLRLLIREGCFPIGFPGFMFRKRHWQEKGGIDEGLQIADHEFLCWLSTQGPSGFIPSIHYLRRLHERNFSSAKRAVYGDFVRVVAKYLRQEPALRDDRDLAAQLRGQFEGIAYWLRDEGFYRDAWHCHAEAMRLWGARPRTLLAMAKLAPHWVLRTVLRRGNNPPVG